jgi:hypothetical protein
VSEGLYRLKQVNPKTKVIVKPSKTVAGKRKHSPLPDRSMIFDDDASAEYIVNRIAGSRKKDETVQRARPVSQRKVSFSTVAKHVVSRI